MKATLVVSALLTALIVIPILAGSEPDGGYWKLIAVLAVLLVLGTLVVPIVRKMSDAGAEPMAPAPPFALSDGAGDLELRYQGRQFRIAVDTNGAAGPIARAWAIAGPEQHPILFDQDSTATDAHAAMANAVVTGMIVVPLLTDVEPAESYWKAFGVPLVLFVLGTLAVPIARTMGAGDDESLETDVPIVPSGGGRELDVRYQGRRFRIAVDGNDGTAAPGARAWAIVGPEERPILFDQAVAAADTHAALAHAVQQITREIDSGRL
jgi:hypothetical protein